MHKSRERRYKISHGHRKGFARKGHERLLPGTPGNEPRRRAGDSGTVNSRNPQPSPMEAAGAFPAAGRAIPFQQRCTEQLSAPHSRPRTGHGPGAPHSRLRTGHSPGSPAQPGSQRAQPRELRTAGPARGEPRLAWEGPAQQGDGPLSGGGSPAEAGRTSAGRPQHPQGPSGAEPALRPHQAQQRAHTHTQP